MQRRWMVAFGFGLVHGFGFSFALRQTLQFAGSHLLASLLSFNVGVELGQIFMLALFIPGLWLLFRYVVAERAGTIILSALVAHTAWHWMIDRASVLSQYRFQWPAVNTFLLAGTMRWLMLLVILAGLIWLLFGVLRDQMSRGAALKIWEALRPASGRHHRLYSYFGTITLRAPFESSSQPSPSLFSTSALLMAVIPHATLCALHDASIF